MGPRSGERGRSRATRAQACELVPLQWGRALVSAEGPFRSRHRSRPVRASMGPRSGERGRVVGNAAVLAKLTRLQWGRALVSAEGTAEIPSIKPGQNASMGPRSGERGRSRARRKLGSNPRGFNGAALW